MRDFDITQYEIERDFAAENLPTPGDYARQMWDEAPEFAYDEDCEKCQGTGWIAGTNYVFPKECDCISYH